MRHAPSVVGIATFDLIRQGSDTEMSSSAAAEKLRAQASLAATLCVFITTKTFGAGPHYHNSYTVTLPEPTAYTPALIRYAHRCLAKIFRPGYRYRKAGVMLSRSFGRL